MSEKEIPYVELQRAFLDPKNYAMLTVNRCCLKDCSGQANVDVYIEVKDPKMITISRFYSICMYHYDRLIDAKANTLLKEVVEE